jgi:predicted AAA+ superfamily ATPase
MQKMKRVDLFQSILHKLNKNPVVALLGPRQVGKSTIAKEIVSCYPNAIYLDLEMDSDRFKIENNPEFFFELNKGKLICLDEVQFVPEIFKILRGCIDKEGTNGQFLILGSASRDLIRQSSETLAGRISYLEVTPFTRNEVIDHNITEYWLKGGYPKSFLEPNTEDSLDWRIDYIQSFLERDLPSLGFRVPSPTLKRFWTMLAHNQGQIVNYSKLGNSLGVSGHTIKYYLDILEQTFIIRILMPYHSNQKKRLVKSPKIYIRDTGLLHAILKIETSNDLLGHPVVGNSFEILIIENLLKKYPRHTPYFFRDSTGNEIDLILEKGLEIIAIEIKLSKNPKIEEGFWHGVKFLRPSKKMVISQVDEDYMGKDELLVTNLDNLLRS